MGLIIPMEAMRKVRNDITTPYVMFLDNDSNVTENWLPPLLEVAQRENVALVNPLTLEKAGVDIGAPLRNHLFTNEITFLTIEGEDYLIEKKNTLDVRYQKIFQQNVTRLKCLNFTVYFSILKY